MFGTSPTFRLARLPGAILLLLALLTPLPPASAEPAGDVSGDLPVITIGVLALRGAERAVEFWTPTAAYLDRHVAGYRFVIEPLDFDEIHVAARGQHIDFVLANSAYFVALEMLYAATPVVTLRTRIGNGPAVSVFGGTLITRADRRDIHGLEDLVGQRFAAVDQQSFGGWQVGWRALQEAGIDPERDLSELVFLGTHDAVVDAVATGMVDAGIARTGTLEQMAREGTISLQSFHILNPTRPAGYPYLVSTRLYPEWPLARMPGVSEDLARSIAIALLEMPPDDPAALAAHAAGWTLPMNYQPVHETLRTLRVGPYAFLRDVDLRAVLERYTPQTIAAGAGLALILVLSLWALQNNRRLRAHRQELNQLNDTLEKRVSERTAEIEALLGQAQRLNHIIRAVADINQIIITNEAADLLLKSCCDRLVANPDYVFSWVALQDDQGNLEPAAHAYGSTEHLRQLLDTAPGGLAHQTLMDNHCLLWPASEEGTAQPPLPPDITGALGLPLRPDAFTTPIGVLCLYSRHAGGFDEQEIALLKQLAGDLGFALNAFRTRQTNQQLQESRLANYEQTVLSLVDMIEKRDTYTAGHSRRVALYSRLLAEGLELPEDEVNRLEKAAILHDIGKIVIPDSILLKPGRLTTLEFDLIKQHVEVGYQTLSSIEMYAGLAEMMRDHHEWLDGSGYPRGLTGDQIPIWGRIMAVADAFDAMTSNRIYKPRKSTRQALEELQSLAGRHYDPVVVSVAQRVLGEITPPSAVDQLPRNAIEHQRFAYFFNDQLTGVHNAAYLEFILRSAHRELFTSALVVYLRDFARFNEEQGWAAGDTLLKGFAAYLQECCPDSQVFRIMGDDFVILNPGERLPNVDRMNRESPLTESCVRAQMEQVSLKADDIETLLGKVHSSAAMY
ncbi:MAG: HD domain-containing phosphohydrolase [Halothiobacillaceae bacterium]